MDGFTNHYLYNRALVVHIYGSQSQTGRVQFLHRPQTPRLFLPRLQSGSTCTAAELAGESSPSRFRAAKDHVSGHAGPVQWIQVALCEHAKREETVVVERGGGSIP